MLTGAKRPSQSCSRSARATRRRCVHDFSKAVPISIHLHATHQLPHRALALASSLRNSQAPALHAGFETPRYAWPRCTVIAASPQRFSHSNHLTSLSSGLIGTLVYRLMLLQLHSDRRFRLGATALLRRVASGRALLSPEGYLEQALGKYALGEYSAAAALFKTSAQNGCLRAFAELSWLLINGRYCVEVFSVIIIIIVLILTLFRPLQARRCFLRCPRQIAPFSPSVLHDPPSLSFCNNMLVPLPSHVFVTLCTATPRPSSLRLTAARTHLASSATALPRE
jgi:hypothetical protein